MCSFRTEASQEIQVKNPRARVDCRNNFLLNDGKKSWPCGRCLCVCVCAKPSPPPNFLNYHRYDKQIPETTRKEKKGKKSL